MSRVRPKFTAATSNARIGQCVYRAPRIGTVDEARHLAEIPCPDAQDNPPIKLIYVTTLYRSPLGQARPSRFLKILQMVNRKPSYVLYVPLVMVEQLCGSLDRYVQAGCLWSDTVILRDPHNSNIRIALSVSKPSGATPYQRLVVAKQFRGHGNWGIESEDSNGGQSIIFVPTPVVPALAKAIEGFQRESSEILVQAEIEQQRSPWGFAAPSHST